MYLHSPPPIDNYSAIVARTIFDHLDASQVPLVINRLKNSCRVGGGFFSTVFTVDDPGNKTNSTNRSEFASEIRHYFSRGELLEYFSDFDVLAYEEILKEDRSHGPIHMHAKARIVAVRCK